MNGTAQATHNWGRGLGRLIDQFTDARSVGVGVFVHLALFVHMRVRVHGPIGMSVAVLMLDTALFVGVARIFLVAGRGVGH